MKIKDMVKVLELSDKQRVKIHDLRNIRIIETISGWDFAEEWEDDGPTQDEIDKIHALKVEAAEIKSNWLYIWAS